MIPSSSSADNQESVDLSNINLIPVRTDIQTSASEDYGSSWGVLEQWVDEIVDFSSSYSGQLGGSYGPANLKGPTRTFPKMQSSGSSWCPQVTTGNQHLIVKFKHAVYIKEVHVYETSYPGSIVKISCKKKHNEQEEKVTEKKGFLRKAIDLVKGNNSEWVVLFERSSPEYTSIAAVDFSPPLETTNVYSDTIRIDMVMQNWSELDGIKLVGRGETKPPKITKLGATYKKMFEDALFTDMVLVHKKSGNTLKVHKSILTSRSEFFKVISECEMIESKTSTVEFEEDHPFPVFKQVIEFLYSNHIHVTQANIFYIYSLADQLLINSLSTYCGRFFSSLLSEKNVFELSKTAQKLNCHKLNEIALEYIVDNYKILFLRPEFAELEQEEILIVCRRLAERHTQQPPTSAPTTVPENTLSEISESCEEEEW